MTFLHAWADHSATNHLIPIALDPAALMAQVLAATRAERLVLGLGDPASPRGDEFWQQTGLSPQDLRCLLARRGPAVELLAQLRQRPTVVGHCTNAALPLCGQLLALRAEHDPGQQVMWWLLLQRREGAFTTNEQAAAHWLLCAWQACFNAPWQGHNRWRRLVLGQGGRLLAGDPLTQLELAAAPGGEGVAAFPAQLFAALEQRWPEMAAGQRHDLILPFAHETTWACVQCHPAGGIEPERGWLVELHPLTHCRLPAHGVMDDPRIAQALAFLHDHFTGSPSLNQLARAVKASPYHFHRLFTRAVGVSPKQYVLLKQLQVAQWLLRHTPLGVREVAQRTGFSSHGHFTTMFHRLLGLSPSTYRLHGAAAAQAPAPKSTRTVKTKRAAARPRSALAAAH